MKGYLRDESDGVVVVCLKVLGTADYTVCTLYMCLPNIFDFGHLAEVLPTVKLKLLLPLLQGI